MTHISSFMFKVPSIVDPVDHEKLKEIVNGNRIPKTVDVIDMATGKEDRNMPVRDALVKYG